jgi:LPXTG-site transpeptidase (sortase) family protein
MTRPPADDGRQQLSTKERFNGLLRLLDYSAAISFLIGIVCTGFFVLAKADQKQSSEAAIAAFVAARDAALTQEPDQALWSENRRADYQSALDAAVGEPTAMLTIPSIDLTVPVFDGTDELVLNRGIGRIEGTARPGTSGNIGLAGHRDGFFRGLKHVEIGSHIDVQTLDGSRRYRVSETMIVDPSEVFVLDPTNVPAVTLVTCYPFYFVGHAPQRFIVRAILEPEQPEDDLSATPRQTQP